MNGHLVVWYPPPRQRKANRHCALSYFKGLWHKSKNSNEEGRITWGRVTPDWGFPGGGVVKNSPVHAGAPSPWIGKMLWRRKWQPTPVCCPGKSHGQRSLVGYSPWGRKDIAPKQQSQTGGNRLDNGQKEDLQSQGRP